MAIEVPNIRIPAGDDLLRIPLCVNINKLEGAERDQLFNAATKQLGAQYFRGKSVFLEVVKDQTKAAEIPRNFQYGPYLLIFLRPKGEIGISSRDKLMGGETVYSPEQFLALAAQVKIEDIAEHLSMAMAEIARRESQDANSLTA